MDVSVIIPCHNHADTLARAAQSALGQTLVCQVVVVDDASTDTSLAQARLMAKRDQRIQVCALPTNVGPGAARNRGVEFVKGSHIVFLDADDEFIGDFVQMAGECFAKNQALMVAKCEMEFLDPVKGYVLPTGDPRYSAAVLSSSCGMVMRRDAFLRLGGFSEDHAFRGPLGGEDVAFMRAVMEYCQPIAKVDTVGYRVWSRPGSHVDRFLASTRLTSVGGFEFVDQLPSQANADAIQEVLEEYLNTVKKLSGY